ncbi:5-fold beta-flower protein [Nonomuraea indica]|uniref:5-fold beta-flower protein n=1 Tax=Nonomuraea indica TaxID=1581193 RepID=UPI003CCBEFBF
MDDIYDANDRKVGYVLGGGVYGLGDSRKGSVEISGWVRDGGDRWVGAVSSTGQVSDTDDRSVGYVRGAEVFNQSGHKVGHVRAETSTNSVNGITDAHKAGAALLLLFLEEEAWRPSAAPPGYGPIPRF